MESCSQSGMVELLQRLESKQSLSQESLQACYEFLSWPRHVQQACLFVYEVQSKTFSGEPDLQQNAVNNDGYVDALLEFMQASLKSFEDKSR